MRDRIARATITGLLVRTVIALVCILAVLFAAGLARAGG